MRNDRDKSLHSASFQFKLLLPAALWAVNRFQLVTKFPKLYSQLYYRMYTLYGSKQAVKNTELFMAEIVSGMAIGNAALLFLFILSGRDPALLTLVVVTTIALPFLLIKEKDRKIKKRNQLMLLELPLLLHQLILLLNAGDTLQQALFRIVHGTQKGSDSPLALELKQVIKKIEHQRISLSTAMEDMNRNCGVQEVSVFINAIMLNYRRGGSQLITVLSHLSHQMWESRRNTAKTLGEEASSKLVFPMVVIFLVVLVVVSAPAILWME